MGCVSWRPKVCRIVFRVAGISISVSWCVFKTWGNSPYTAWLDEVLGKCTQLKSEYPDSPPTIVKENPT